MIRINENILNVGMFPNRERYLNKKEIKHLVNLNKSLIKITFNYENDSDFIHLMFIKAGLDRFYPKMQKILYISYMPYSRMDRENNIYLFTLKYVSTFINNLNFDEIIVEEPHSDVCLALLNNCRAIYFTKDYLDKVIKILNFDKKTDYLFFPDAGAQKRYSDLTGFNTLVGYKERDIETGNIIKYDIMGDTKHYKNKKIIILDDLCSKGGTFMLAAKELKKKGVGDIYLFVGHTEENIFNGSLLTSDLIKRVITSDSMVKMVNKTRKTDNKITIITRGEII